MSDQPLLPRYRDAADEGRQVRPPTPSPPATSSTLEAENEVKPSALRRLFARLLRIFGRGAKDDAAGCRTCGVNMEAFLDHQRRFLAHEEEFRAWKEGVLAWEREEARKVGLWWEQTEKNDEQTERGFAALKKERAEFEERKMKWEKENRKKGGKGEAVVRMGGVIQPAKQPVASGSRRVAGTGGGMKPAPISRLLEELDEVERNKKWDEAKLQGKKGGSEVKGKGKGKDTDA